MRTILDEITRRVMVAARLSGDSIRVSGNKTFSLRFFSSAWGRLLKLPLSQFHQRLLERVRPLGSFVAASPGFG